MWATPPEQESNTCGVSHHLHTWWCISVSETDQRNGRQQSYSELKQKWSRKQDNGHKAFSFENLVLNSLKARLLTKRRPKASIFPQEVEISGWQTYLRLKHSNPLFDTLWEASIPGLGRSPGEGKGSPFQYSGRENPMDYSPWGHKELDTTEPLWQLFWSAIQAFSCLAFDSAVSVLFGKTCLVNAIF